MFNRNAMDAHRIRRDGAPRTGPVDGTAAREKFVHGDNKSRPPQRERRCRVRSNFTTTEGLLCIAGSAKNKKKQRVSGTPRCNSCRHRLLIKPASALDPRLIVNRAGGCGDAAQARLTGGWSASGAKFRETAGNCETMRCES
ncbi:unnamed protein product, partial [Iphiclides podalirius]